MSYFVYILYNKKHDKFYIGQTYSLAKRVAEHNIGLSKYTSRYEGGWNLSYQELYLSRSEAVRREKFLKAQKNKSFYRNICGLTSLAG